MLPSRHHEGAMLRHMVAPGIKDVAVEFHAWRAGDKVEKIFQQMLLIRGTGVIDRLSPRGTLSLVPLSP